MIDERLPTNSQASDKNKHNSGSSLFKGSLFSQMNIRRQQKDTEALQTAFNSVRPFNQPSFFARPAPLIEKRSPQSPEEARKMYVLKTFLTSCDEMGHLPQADYFKFHPNLTVKVRRYYVEMIIHYSMMISVKTDVAFDAVNMFDRFFSSTQSACTEKEIEVVTIVSFYVALQNAKLTEFTLNHLVKLNAGGYSNKEVQEMINYFEKTVNYGPRFTSSLQFFDAFACCCSMTDTEKHFGWMLLESALMDYKMIDCLPSLQALSAVFITHYFYGKKFNPLALLSLLHHQEDVYHRVKDRMLDYFHRLRQHKSKVSLFVKFASSNYYSVSSQEFLDKPAKLELIR